MSSLMEKNKLPGLDGRSKMFLRSNSFQKLCSLAHPMRLKGFKSNKEALKSVFESLIITTRGVLQSVTYRILGFLFLTPFSKLVSGTLESVTKDGRFKTVRLFLRLTLSMIISTDKSECDNGRFDCPTEDEPTSRLVDCVDTAVQTEDRLDSSETEELAAELFFDCEEESQDTVSAKPSTEELRHRLLDNSSQDKVSQNNQLPLRLSVYTCIVGCFVQLSALAYLLNVAASFPPGLVFLIAALGYIGYVMMRITFNQCSPAEPMHTKAPVEPPRKKSTATKGIHPILAAVSKQVSTVLQSKQMMMVPVSNGSRMSRCDIPPRSRSRPSAPRLLCTDDKTISKIKLL